MRRRIEHIVLVLFLFSCTLRAQDDRDNIIEGLNFQEIIENLVQNTDADFENDTYIETLQDFYENPIDLNKTSEDELGDLGLLDYKQVSSLMLYRNMVGPFFNIYELQAVPHLDIPTIRKILPFVQVKGKLDDFKVPLIPLLFQGKHQLFIRYSSVLEEQKGYRPVFDAETNTSSTPYAGDASKLYLRYRYKYGNKISYGLTAEKDAGESFFKANNKQGFDFYSAHFFLRDVGPFSHIALGDYHVKLGQGLTIWTDLTFGKSSTVIDIKRQATPLKPYTSVNEFNFFRGAAATVDISSDLNLTGFVSYKPADGSVVERDSLDEAGGEQDVFSSLQASGNHRTAGEISRKNAINVFNTGGHLRWERRHLKLGATGLITRFDKPIEREDILRNQFRFAGDQLVNLSIDYKYIFKNFHFFGETAWAGSGGIATVNGALINLDSTIDFALLHRFYQADYESFYSNGFGESNGNRNEQGLYFGTKVKLHKNWTLASYYDLFRYKWLRSLADAPTNGQDFLVRLGFRPSRSLEAYIRFRTRGLQFNFSGNLENIDVLAPARTHNYRIHLKYKLNKALTLQSRLELARFQLSTQKAEHGMLLYQDFAYKPLSFPLSFNLRFAIFNNDPRAPTYAYENDVLYSYSNPAYRHSGTRFYVVVKYKLLRGMDVWLRFAQTYLYNQESIGSGNDLIDGKKKSEIRAQVRFKF